MNIERERLVFRIAVKIWGTPVTADAVQMAERLVRYAEQVREACAMALEAERVKTSEAAIIRTWNSAISEDAPIRAWNTAVAATLLTMIDKVRAMPLPEPKEGP